MTASAASDWLEQQWQSLLASLGSDPLLSRRAFADLVEHYRSPGRVYHTLTHIEHVQKTLAALLAEADDPTAVLLAAWFHDVIYDPRAGDNEEQSAACALKVLNELGIDAGKARRVAELILLTKAHRAAPSDRDGQILVDADLAILAAEPAEYQRYAQAIRREYAWVPEGDYRKVRKAVLEKFLGRKQLFHCARLRALEERARENLRREIGTLGPGS